MPDDDKQDRKLDRRSLLIGAAPLMLVGMTLAGRLITVAATGFDATMGPPMLVEAVITGLLVLGRRGLAKSQNPFPL